MALSLFLLLLIFTVADVSLNQYQTEIGVSETELRTFHSLKGIAGLIPDSMDNDPILVLGVFASNDQERAKYARLYLRREQDRAERELKFFRAYQKEFEKAAGNGTLPGIISPLPPLKTSPQAHLVIVLPEICRTCTNLMSHAAGRIHSGHLLQIDLHFPEDMAHAEIRAWASDNGVDADLVQNGNITLNQGLPTRAIQTFDQSPKLFWREGDRLVELTIAERTLLVPSN